MPIELDKTKFDAALRDFRKHSKRAVGLVLRDQAKGVVREIANRTPPGGPNVDGRAAKERGEAAVVGDIHKIMEKGRAKEAVSDPTAIHKRYRNSRGRVRREISPKIKVRAGDLARLIRTKKAMVGFLASGWRTAATKFGVNLPAWVKRHTGHGSAREKADAASVEVVATNSVGYASRAANMDKIVQASLNAQAGNMRRQVEHFVAKAAKRAGFR